MVFGFFKRKKKEDPAVELAAVVQELVRTQEKEEKD